MYLYVAMVLFVAPVICCHFIGEYAEFKNCCIFPAPMDVSDVFLHARASRKSSDLKEKLENVFASWTITKLCIFHISLIKLKRLNRKYYTNNI